MRHEAFLLLPLLLATSLWAEPSNDLAKRDETAPSFFIEDILVEGNRHVSPGIVVAESLLETGTSYSEDELREAVYRIKRLPFLLGVDFELRKGSERGRYVLVIAILETTRFFYAVDFRNTYAVDESDLGPGELRSDWSGDFLVGYRYFVGNQGILYLTAGDIGAQLGYSNFNFLGRNIFFNVSLERSIFCCPSSRTFDDSIRIHYDDRSVMLRLTVGIPRSARQLWRLDAFHRRSDSNFRQRRDGVYFSVSEQDLQETRLRASWIYDTTDDPVFPSRGDELTVTAEAGYQNGRATDVFNYVDAENYGSTGIDRRSSGWSDGVSLSGRRFFPLGHRQNLAASLKASAGHFEHDIGGEVLGLQGFDSDSWHAEASLRHAVDLVGAKRSQPQRRLRWENGVEYSYGEVSGTLSATAQYATAAWRSELIYRSRWGVFRLSFRLIDVVEDA